MIFHVGAFALPAHLVFESLGYFLGFRSFLWLRGRWRDPLPTETRYLVIAAAVVGAALGARILAMLQNLPSQPSLAGLATAAGGKTIVGGLLGGFMSVEWVKRALGVRIRTGDLFVLPLCIGIAIGRVGCFLAGLTDHTYGNPTRLPWGVDFGDGLSRHPTQLYEIAALALIAAWAWRARRSAGFETGDLFRGFITFYCAFRFALEVIKPEPRLALGMSAIQWTCLMAIGSQYSFARRFLRYARGTRSAAPPIEPRPRAPR